MIILTTQDFPASLTGRWHIGGIPMYLRRTETFVSYRSRPVLLTSWKRWEHCPNQSWWLGLCQTVSLPQSGRNMWTNSRRMFLLMSLANAERRTALGIRSTTVLKDQFKFQAVKWFFISSCFKIRQRKNFLRFTKFFDLKIPVCVVHIVYPKMRHHYIVHCTFTVNMPINWIRGVSF